MHELSIAMSIVDLAQEEAARRSVTSDRRPSEAWGPCRCYKDRSDVLVRDGLRGNVAARLATDRGRDSGGCLLPALPNAPSA